MIGREVELAAIRNAIEADRPLIVTGEAGIGKTTLALAAVAASGRGGRVGGAFATIGWMPYFALERAVGRKLHGDAAWVSATVESIVGPDVLLVDDLQWADAGTLAAVAALAGRVAAVAICRTGTADAAAAAAELTDAGFDRLDIGPMEPRAAALVALGARPELGADRARAVAERAGGNPFAIEQLAVGGDAAASLRRAIDGRISALSEDGRRGLTLLAFADRPVVAASVDGADDLLEAGLAIRTGEDLAIRHALLGDAVRDAADEPMRRATHRRLADLVTDAGERARHLLGAGHPVDAHALALEAVAASTSPGERAAHLGVAAATATGRAADDLRLEAAAALRVAGDLDGAATVLSGLEGEDAELRARAAAVEARIAWSRGDPEAMRAAIGRGLELTAGRRTPAAALLAAERVTVTGLVDGRFDQAVAEADEAVALARETGADPTRALLLRATILAGIGRAGWDEALEATISSARASGDVETELSAANNLVAGHEMHGRPEAGRALAASMLQRAEELGLAGWGRQFATMLANLDLHAGRLRVALERAQALIEEALDPLAEQQAGLIAALALVDLGRGDDALPVLDRLLGAAAPDVTGAGDVRYVLAEAAFWAGRPIDALVHLEAYRAFEGSEYPTSFLVDVSGAWAALDGGRPLPGRLAKGMATGMLIGAQREREGIELLATNDPGGAAARLREAAEGYAGFHRRGELRAGWAAAEAARQAEADTSRVVPDLERLEADALADGFDALLVRIQRSLRLAGIRRTSRRATLDRSDLLTPRERQLAGLVGRGLTNAEIARRMGLGRPTVARLLSNAMGKLGAESRAQLAARIEEAV